MAEPPGTQKEMRIEQAIDQNHDQSRVQHWQGQDDEEGIDEDHPRKERQPPQRHVLCATAEDSGDEVNVGTDRADAQDKE